MKPLALAVTVLAAVIAVAASTPMATDQRNVYSDGLLNENTEMLRTGGRILLIVRGGEQARSARRWRTSTCSSRATRGAASRRSAR